jgi:hypothetical protein
MFFRNPHRERCNCRARAERCGCSVPLHLFSMFIVSHGGFRFVHVDLRLKRKRITQSAIRQTYINPVDLTKHMDRPAYRHGATSLQPVDSVARTDQPFRTNAPAAERLTSDSCRNSSPLRRSEAAPRFSSRCFTEDVPGIGSMIGERCKSHANATWNG